MIPEERMTSPHIHMGYGGSITGMRIWMMSGFRIPSHNIMRKSTRKKDRRVDMPAAPSAKEGTANSEAWTVDCRLLRIFLESR
jgi:hypothetical protein